MKTTAFVLALTGAIVGILFALSAIAIGDIGSDLGDDEGNTIVWLGISALVACIFAIVCAALFYAGKWPGWMALGLVIAAFWHLISISLFGAFGFVLLLLAGVFGWFGRKSRHEMVPARDAAPENQLARLAELHKAGILTDQEFTSKKAELLGRM